MPFKKTNKTFITGLITILPVAATAYLLFWLAATAENFLGRLLRFLLPEELYRPGMGVAAGIMIVFLVGLLMETWLVRALVEKIEKIIYRVPLVKGVYGAIREFISFLSQDKNRGAARQVVIVSPAGKDFQLLGFVTRDNLCGLDQGIDRKYIAVYLPFSYQIGGYTVLVPRSAVQPLDVSIEKAMRFIMTAGITERECRQQQTFSDKTE